ncbi:MAG: pilus assembly protein PilP [bacterium]|nr:pilus assembly protein PilP [bacterium]
MFKLASFCRILMVVTLSAVLCGTWAVASDDPASISPSQEARQRINALRANEFFYQSYGKEDPFRGLVDGKYKESVANEMVDMNSAHLVGVMWGQEDRFALVEDGEGFGYILRVGDRVRFGRVVSIRKTSLTARVTLYGITNKVVLKLEKTEG